MNISAVLVTRGDVDMTPILDSLPFEDIVLWDNSKRSDEGLYGRYAGIAEAKHEIVYVQDDDLIFRHQQELIDRYEDGKIVCNYPPPWDIPWIGLGALFHRDLPFRAFDRYLAVYPDDEFFRRHVCDAVFSLLTPSTVLDLPYERLPWDDDPGRISNSPGWYDSHRPEIQRRCALL